MVALELIRHTFFDTKELSEEGLAELRFFSEPNRGSQLSNWYKEGCLPHPQRFYLFGLLLNIYSVSSRGKPSEDLQSQRRALVDDCNLSYRIGAKYYLDVPVTSTVSGLLPGDAPEIYKNMFQVPEIKEAEKHDTQRAYGLVQNVTYNKDFVGPVVNPEPGDFFYGMCIFRRDKQSPLHILCQQFVEAGLTWPEKKGCGSVLGKVRFRVSMLGVLARELQ